MIEQQKGVLIMIEQQKGVSMWHKKQFIRIKKVEDNSSVTIYHVSKDWTLTCVDKRFNSIEAAFAEDQTIEVKQPAVVLYNNGASYRYITTHGELPQIPEADLNLLIFKCRYINNDIDSDRIRYAGYLLGLCSCVRVPRDGNWIRIRPDIVPFNKLSHGLEFACYRNNKLFVSRIDFMSSDTTIHRISENDNTLHIGTKIDNTKGDDAYNWRYVNTTC